MSSSNTSINQTSGWIEHKEIPMTCLANQIYIWRSQGFQVEIIKKDNNTFIVGKKKTKELTEQRGDRH